MTETICVPEASVKEAKTRQLLVPFCVNIQKVRTSIRKVSEGYLATVSFKGGKDICSRSYFAPAVAMEEAVDAAGWLVAEVSLPVGTLQPHPWRCADGSLIKAPWESSRKPEETSTIKYVVGRYDPMTSRWEFLTADYDYATNLTDPYFATAIGPHTIGDDEAILPLQTAQALLTTQRTT